MSRARLIALAGWIAAAFPAAVPAAEGRLVSVEVDITLHRKHQACIADIHDAAGRITAIRLTPSVKEPAWLDGLVTYWYWDGSETPFIVCSVRQLLALLDADGTTRGLPELYFSRGFRILVECATGRGGRLQGTLVYEAASDVVPPRRTRFDPDLGIASPQSVETVITSPAPARRGRGERVAVPNGGFESGTLAPWWDISWEEGFRVYPSGTEGVPAHAGKFMAGQISGGDLRGAIRVGGLVPGYRYRLSSQINTYAFDGKPRPEAMKVRIGINPLGMFLDRVYPEEGEAWAAEFSHECFRYAHCWGARFSADSQDHWSNISVAIRARGEVAAIYLLGGDLLGKVRKWCLFDEVTLENIPIPMGTIEGRVLDGRGEGLKQATVLTSPWALAARADEQGSFRIEDVPEGVYAVEVSNRTQTARIDGVRVLADRSARVELAVADTGGSRIVVSEPQKGENLLIDGGFESGDTVGWQRAYECDAMSVRGASRRVAPPSGSFMFGGEHVYHHAGSREIIYQRVPVRVGSTWTLSGRLFAHSADGSSDEAACHLVADPTGRTDFPIASAKHNGDWKYVSLRFAATADMIAVGVAMEQRARPAGGLSEDKGIVGSLADENVRTDYNGYYCDDLRLVLAGPDAETAKAQPRPNPTEVAAGTPFAMPASATATATFPDGKTRIELVRIPAGTFLMGGDSRSGWTNADEFPRHRVTLDAYWIGRYEVTNAQYKAFCDHQKYPYPPDPAFSKIPWAHPERRYHYGDYFTAMPDHPVVNVTWHDAQAFCRWAGLRLPTEAEWEMAARGPGDSLRTYPWGEQTDTSWTTRCRDNTMLQQIPDWSFYTAPVGTFETHEQPYAVGRSAMGVSEMGGNVREWCSDWYGLYASNDQTNPKGHQSGAARVLRGGCWRGRDYGVMTRCSYRHNHDPSYYEWATTGFRAAAGDR